MAESKIDISGLDKSEVLLKLLEWSNSGFPFTPLLLMQNPPSKDELWAAINRGHIDYFRGFSIKMDLNNNVVDAMCYDRDSGPGRGPGTARKAINELRGIRS
jgi:hypothetical protein